MKTSKLPTVPPLPSLIRHPVQGRLLTFDPGDHIGWSIFYNSAPVSAGTFYGNLAEGLSFLGKKIQEVQPRIIVAEDYFVYKTHLKEHTYSDVPVAQLLGALKFICLANNIPLIIQSAAVGKKFTTDYKIARWNLDEMFDTDHAADAFRHGVHYLVFGGKPWNAK